MAAVIAKEYNIDTKNEKELKRLRDRAGNLLYVFGLYIARSDIYMNMGLKEKADRDIKTACGQYWFEEICKDLEKDTKKPAEKPVKKKR